MPEPSADGDDIDALVDQLTGMGMAQHMECEFLACRSARRIHPIGC
jgi:hypothetical protein